MSAWCLLKLLRTSADVRSDVLVTPPLDGAPKHYSPKIQKLVSDIASLTLLEVSDLNELLKKTLNIQDVAMMPTGGTAAPGPQIYTGKSASGIPERKQGKRVVLDLTTGLQGHNITCDNFFTSYDLGQELLRRKLTMVATVRKNKPELPAEMLLVKDRAPLSSKFVFTDTTTVVSYCPKKQRNVILMSTLH
ncbi:39S ribosomal protein L12, mitochondrial isoform X3 [Syngnathus typhle]|nr:39S ribosomal protein L12, mitochondrial isoform X3 [Syngnathus typhle]